MYLKIKKLEGKVVAIRCTHGDTVLYPMAQVHLEIHGHSIEVEAAVSDTLPMSVLLGTDVPQLQDLIGQALYRENKPEVSWQSLQGLSFQNRYNMRQCYTKQITNNHSNS